MLAEAAEPLARQPSENGHPDPGMMPVLIQACKSPSRKCTDPSNLSLSSAQHHDAAAGAVEAPAAPSSFWPSDSARPYEPDRG